MQRGHSRPPHRTFSLLYRPSPRLRRRSDDKKYPTKIEQCATSGGQKFYELLSKIHARFLFQLPADFVILLTLHRLIQ
jgi:hypothetical protein